MLKIRIKKDRKDLYEHLESVMKLYEKADPAHGIDHIEDVLGNVAELVKRLNMTNLNEDILYTAAVYHDIGTVTHGRKDHNLYSAEFVLNDEKLKDYFSDMEINIIANACREHRASYKGEYSSIYSKIISDADRDGGGIERMIKRSYAYNKHNNPQYNSRELYESIYKHLKEKFGYGGYARYNLQDSEALLKDARDILENENRFLEVYLNVIDK